MTFLKAIAIIVEQVVNYRASNSKVTRKFEEVVGSSVGVFHKLDFVYHINFIYRFIYHKIFHVFHNFNDGQNIFQFTYHCNISHYLLEGFYSTTEIFDNQNLLII